MISKRDTISFRGTIAIAAIKVKIRMLKPKFFNYKVMTNYKVCIKGHKWDICKALKNYSSISYSKTRKCDVYKYQKLIYKDVIRKYYTTCSITKKKYLNYKNLYSKYISNNKFILFY